MNFIKKHYKFLVFILVCISIYLIFKLNNHHNVTYLALGDSFALGENAYGEIDYGYSDYLKDYLTKENKLNKYIKSYSTRNASIKTLYQDILLNKKIKLNNKEYNIKQTLRESRILTISIGLNDLTYELNINDNITDNELNRIITEIEKEFTELIDEIRKYYPYEIYVVGYYNIYPDSYLYEKAINKLNNIYINNEEVIYIDTYKIFKNNKNYHPHFLNYYPTREGYEAISQELITKIRKKLEK